MITENEYNEALEIVTKYEVQEFTKYDLYTVKAGDRLELLKDPETKKGQLTRGNIYKVVDIGWLNHPAVFMIRDNNGDLYKVTRRNFNHRWAVIR